MTLFSLSLLSPKVSVDGELVKGSELFNDELSLPELKVRCMLTGFPMHSYLVCTGSQGCGCASHRSASRSVKGRAFL